MKINVKIYMNITKQYGNQYKHTTIDIHMFCVKLVFAYSVHGKMAVHAPLLSSPQGQKQSLP